MELEQILSSLGKTIYVVDYKMRDMSGNKVYSQSAWTITEIRFPNDPHFYSLDNKEMKVVFIYNLEYDDCYDTFGIYDIGKTVFFTEEEAQKKVDELNTNRKE